jgi:hypothetical protein
MAERHTGDPRSGSELGFIAFGVRCALSVNPADLLRHAEALLPPGWLRCAPAPDDLRFSLSATGGTYRVKAAGPAVATTDLDVALKALDAQIRAYVALRAPRHIFIHAAVVAAHGQAIVIPGPSFSGKTTLALALLEAGATYYSDEFAVLDQDGLVHPYAKPLSIRADGAPNGSDLPPHTLGISTGGVRLSVGLIAVTRYRPNARWQPSEATPGAGALALLANAVAGRERPDQALATIVKAAAHAQVLEGDRGDAGEAAHAILGSAWQASRSEGTSSMATSI